MNKSKTREKRRKKMAEIRNGFVSMGWRPDLEAGVSGGGGGYARGTASFRSVKGPRSGRAAAWGGEEEVGRQQYFLDSCFLCKRHLGGVGDIFMYRGDMAFCSEECREEQMEIDEMSERSLRKMSMKMKASSRKEQQKAAKSAAHGVTVVAG